MFLVAEMYCSGCICMDERESESIPRNFQSPRSSADLGQQTRQPSSLWALNSDTNHCAKKSSPTWVSQIVARPIFLLSRCFSQSAIGPRCLWILDVYLECPTCTRNFLRAYRNPSVSDLSGCTVSVPLRKLRVSAQIRKWHLKVCDSYRTFSGTACGFLSLPYVGGVRISTAKPLCSVEWRTLFRVRVWIPMQGE